MRDDKLQEIIELLPYSIRYSGEIEELLDYAKEQAERVEELEEKLHFCEMTKLSMDSVEKYTEQIKSKNRRYREALKFYANERNYEDIGIPTGNNPPALPILEDRGQVARKELEGEE